MSFGMDSTRERERDLSCDTMLSLLRVQTYLLIPSVSGGLPHCLGRGQCKMKPTLAAKRNKKQENSFVSFCKSLCLICREVAIETEIELSKGNALRRVNYYG